MPTDSDHPILQPDFQAHTTIMGRDGRLVLVRHMRVDDAALLERLFYRLSPEALYQRFFIPVANTAPERVQTISRALATIDPHRELALIAAVSERGQSEAVGVARYALLEQPGYAEASIILRDDYQGVGMGRQLFDLLIQAALAHGVEHMTLLTHAENQGMIGVARGLGLPYSARFTGGLYEVDLHLRGEG